MEVLLIRHAQSQHNVRATKDLDSDLTSEGYSQAKNVAKWLKENFDLSGFQGLTSPYLRTCLTAHEISCYTDIEFNIEPEIREFHIDKTEYPLNMGGITIYGSDAFPFWNYDKELYFANEDLHKFVWRLEKYLSSLNPNGKYLMVSHGSPIRTMYTLLTGKDMSKVIERYDENKHLFQQGKWPKDSIGNASLTWVNNGESIWFSKVSQ